MKYYSEITKKTYDTVEALQDAETKIKNQMEAKMPSVPENNERKEAANAVEAAFAAASKQRKENAKKREELDDKCMAFNRKYDEEIAKIEKARQAEEDEVANEFRKLDKLDEEVLEEAYKQLRAFCKKYGTYHYSVDADGDLFPMLMGFGRIESAQNVFKDMFNSMFNLW